jgi:hypothetical protein
MNEAELLIIKQCDERLDYFYKCKAEWGDDDIRTKIALAEWDVVDCLLSDLEIKWNYPVKYKTEYYDHVPEPLGMSDECIINPDWDNPIA